MLGKVSWNMRSCNGHNEPCKQVESKPAIASLFIGAKADGAIYLLASALRCGTDSEYNSRQAQEANKLSV